MLTSQEISSLAIFIPLMIVGLKLKTGNFKLYLFFAFLLAGALVDSLGYFANMTNQLRDLHAYFLIIYLFLEAFFFLWIGTYFLVKKIKKSIRLIIGLFFLIFFFVKYYLEFRQDIFIHPFFFSMSCLVVISLITGYSLLKMSEQDIDLLSFSWFWILSGIFLYSFGTFFIDALLYTKISTHIWFIRNYINIIQYGFFEVGLILYKSDLPQKSPFFSN